MPFIRKEDTMPSFYEPHDIAPTVIEDDIELEKPPSLDIAAAAFRQINTLGSAGTFFARGGFVNDRKDFTYDSVTPLTGTEYEPYVDRFYDADTDEEVQTIKNRIDGELKDRDILSRGGKEAIFWSLSAAILDPINLIPIGGLLAKGTQAVKLAKGIKQTSKALASTAAQTGGVLGLSATGEEILLHQSQETRTLEESVENVAVATFLGIGLGTTFGAISKTLSKKISSELDVAAKTDESIDSFLAEKRTLQENNPMPNDGSLSASASAKETLEDLTIYGVAARGVAKVLKTSFGGFNPVINLIQSPLVKVRQTLEQWVDLPFLLNKNFNDQTTTISVENSIKQMKTVTSTAVDETNNLFNAYSKRISKEILPDGQKPLTHEQFNQAVYQEIMPKPGDRYWKKNTKPNKNGQINVAPEIIQSANIQAKAYDYFLTEGIAAGVFPKSMKLEHLIKYAPRMYDLGKIALNEDLLRSVIMKYLPGHLKKSLNKMKELQLSVKKLRKSIKTLKKDKPRLPEALKELEELEDQLDVYRITSDRVEEGDYDSIVDQLVGTLKRETNSFVGDPKTPVTKGPLMELTLGFIPQEALMPFLNTNSSDVMLSYARQVAPEIEFARRGFKKDGIDELLGEINNGYRDLRAAALTDKEKIKLDKQRANDIKDIEHIYDTLRETAGRPKDSDGVIHKFLYSTRLLSYTSKFGGMLVSSVSDLARTVAIKGLGAVLTEGLIPMITNYKGYKLSAAEARKAGAALDVGRAAIIADILNPTNTGKRFKSGLDYVSDKFTRVTAILPFDTARRTFGGVLIQRDIFEKIDLLVDGKLGKLDAADLASNGIGEVEALKIQTMWKEHGLIDGEFYIANADKWKDKHAQMVFRAALSKQINHFSTWIGAGDRPRWMSEDLGKSILQGESFNMAATSKVLISNLQHLDLKTFNSMVTATALGSMVYGFKEMAAGRELSNKPADWIAGGVDQSGLLGIVSSFNNRLYQISGGKFSAGKAIGADNAEFRTGEKDIVVGLLGPSGGYLSDLATPLKKLFDGEPWTHRDTAAIRRLIPFQNLFWLRHLLDKAEEGINNTMGVKNKK